MEKSARDLNNNRVILPSVSLINLKTPPIPNGTNVPVTTEASKLALLESRLMDYPSFLDGLAERATDWGIATRRSVESLQRWAITIGPVLEPASTTSVPCPAYNAFTSLLSSLSRLCATLETDIRMTFNALLHKLKGMIENPKRLLKEMHTLVHRPCSLLVIFRRRDTSRNRQRYLCLQSDLLSQLPVLLDAMDRAIGLAVRITIQGFLEVAKEKWIAFFNSLKEEGERYGGTEETLRAWRERWEVGRQMLLVWEERYALEK